VAVIFCLLVMQAIVCV